MVDDKWYSKVKTTLDDNYLLGKQEYPQDLLAAKWLLADFKGTRKPKKRGSKEEDTAGVTFAKQGGKWAPVCHGCGCRFPGGWLKCPCVTEEHRKKVQELDAAGHFRRSGGGGRSGTSKQGAVNAATGAETNDAPKE